MALNGRARQRWAVGIVAVLLVGVAVAGAFAAGRPSNLPAHPDNPRPQGAMALTRLLEEHGVRVTLSQRTSSTVESPPDVLAIVDPGLLSDEQFAELAALGTDLVLLDAAGGRPGTATEGLESTGHAARSPVAAECSFEHARAAGEITAAGPTFTGPPGAQVCFPAGEDGGLVAHWREGGRSITVIPREVALNGGLAETGNAALALRVLGAGEELTWMLASADDTSGVAADEPLTLLWTAAAILAVALAWWQIPRFGRLAVEPLPVTVPAAETVLARGALYRRHRDVPHAARALRLGALRRIGERLRLPASASREEVLAAIAASTGRPAAALAEVFYGEPPTDTRTLSALAHALDTTESEVHRR